MDTTTYASLAAIPWSVIRYRQAVTVQEMEFVPFDLAYLGR